jgi:broad-specificity NMP kinase
MGVRNFLIEGVSGAGKTTVAEELQRRGHHVIHGDRKFAYYGDPQTGEPLQRPAFDNEADKIAWGYPRWVWPVEKVRALLADKSHPMTFFCGGSRNAHHFVDQFDAVFVLELDVETLDRRLAGRGADEFGGKPLERDLVMRIRASGEGLPESGIRIDATRPVAEIVDDIISRCDGPR